MTQTQHKPVYVITVAQNVSKLLVRNDTNVLWPVDFTVASLMLIHYHYLTQLQSLGRRKCCKLLLISELCKDPVDVAVAGKA